MAFPPDAQSPSDMMDTDDAMDESLALDSEKEALAVVTPDRQDQESTPTHDILMANDFEAMKEVVLPPLTDEPKILEDAVYTWSVTEWRTKNKKEHGPIFKAGGFPWRILLFPYGNNTDHLSLYMEHGFEPDEMPENWSCCVQFALCVWNPEDPTLEYHNTAFHRFTKAEGDWGFTKFYELRRMFNHPWNNSTRPLIENDGANITAYVRIVEDETGVLWHNFEGYDSKKETGFVGLKNQGATCYLNSLLQSLYFTNAFRKAVYGIHTEEDEAMNNSAYTLQRLFYQLQTSNAAVSTSELTKSFGWETRHIFEQQDVQELSRKLMERLEEKMKGTESATVLPDMFSGKSKTYISCINVDYESSRVEDFWDVQLNVSGDKNLLESFQDYIQVEKMDGDNQYFAGDEHKLQDANKGVIFQSFPNVLHLQLKRFEYDIQRDTMMKINDRYEFPETFDAAPYLAEDADRSESWTYQLHGVLVHSGDLNAGHYYAFLKPTKDGWFYKYDDDRVTRATMREVLEENFGGEYRLPNTNVRGAAARRNPIMRPNSAYMLVYIRQSRVDSILTPVTADDTPKHLQLRFEQEEAAREVLRKERQEQHLYMSVKVITTDSFAHHSGFDLAPQNVVEGDPAVPRQYKLLRTTTLADLAARVGEDTQTDPKRLRFWALVKRQNQTIRPDHPFMDFEACVEHVAAKVPNLRESNLILWAEEAEEVDANGEAIWPTNPALFDPSAAATGKDDNIVLLLKCYDAKKQTLQGAGTAYINREKRIEDLVPAIKKKMGWPEKLPNDEKLMMWEEIKPNMIENLKGKTTFKAAELQDGDIICFQRLAEKKPGLGEKLGLGEKSQEEVDKDPEYYEDARQYYDSLFHRREIKLYPHPLRCDVNKYPHFDIALHAKSSYDQMAEKAGKHLGIPGTHLKFYTVNHSTGNPKAPVKRNLTIHGIMNPQGYSQLNINQRNDALYFEVLDMSLAELETRKSVKVTWLSEGISKEDTYDLLVPKSGTVAEVLEQLIQKAELKSEAEAGKIRLYEVHGHKVHKILPRDHPVISLNDYTSVIAERIPEEEVGADENDLVNCFHFQGEPNRLHGIPFKFLLRPDELFSETKKRLEKRTGFKGKSFEKIRFALIRRSHYSKPAYIGDDDVLIDHVNIDDDSLGLDHPDRSRSIRSGAGDLFLK